MTRAIFLISALVLVISGTFWFGFKYGSSNKELEHQRAIQNLNDQLATTTALLKRKEAERLAQIRELSDLVDQLEDQAREDPNADRPALGADSVMRLNRVD